jgi:AcrR family transcriptional regulator
LIDSHDEARRASFANIARVKRGADTRTALLESGIALFGRHGYDGVTTRELTDAAGVNLSAIKYHFGDKDELYHAAIVQLSDEIEQLIGPRIDDLRAGVAHAAGDRHALHGCAVSFAEQWCRAVLLDKRAQRRIPFIVRELSMPSKHFTVLYERFFRPLAAAIEALVAAYGATAAGDPSTIVRAHGMANILLGFVGSESVLWRRMAWKRYTPDRIEIILATLPHTFAAALDTAT